MKILTMSLLSDISSCVSRKAASTTDRSFESFFPPGKLNQSDIMKLTALSKKEIFPSLIMLSVS